MRGWGWVLAGGCFEAAYMYCMKRAETDESWWLWFLVCCVVSFEFLARGIRTVPLGLAYAVWTGIGTVGTVLLGALLFGDPLSPVRVLLLAVLLGSLVWLKASHHDPVPDTAPTERA